MPSSRKPTLNGSTVVSTVRPPIALGVPAPLSTRAPARSPLSAPERGEWIRCSRLEAGRPLLAEGRHRLPVLGRRDAVGPVELVLAALHQVEVGLRRVQGEE